MIPHQNDPHDQELLDFQTKLKNLHEVVGALSQAPTFDEFCRLAVELGHSCLGFDRLGLWFIDTDPRFAVGSFGTDESGQLRDERGERFAVSYGDFTGGMRQVRESRKLFRNIPLLNQRSEVVGAGDCVRGHLYDGERIIGWLDADNLIRHEPWSDYKVELLGLYATSLGHLIVRRRIEDALRAKEEATRRFQDKLRALHEVTSELSKTRSFDDLCRRAVELGRGKLGFDRLGLWFLDTDPRYMVGSFGIDENGLVRDERNRRLRVSAGEFTQTLLDGRVYAATRDNVPLYNDCHEVIGTGWKAVAVMWDGARSLGWVTTDNLFSGQILSSYQLELLSLYATTLGHLAVVRKREEALAAERNLFRTVIDAMPDYIYVKDLEHRFLLVNKASWEDTPGFSGESDFFGKTDFDILPHDYAKRYWEDEQHIIASGEPIVNAEEPGRSRDGLPKTLLTTKVPLCGLDGRVIGLAGVSRDITDRKRIERQALELAVERERINALRQSITSISHDLRTPLFAINASLYLLEHVADPEKRKGQLETIKQQTAALERFVKEIELSSQLETASGVSRSLVNLNKLAARVVQTLSRLAEKKKLALITRLQPGLPDISGNETELEQVLENLTQNAIIYTNEGGRIELSTARESGRVVVEIADTGIGIDEADLPYIFDHFFRVDRARTMGKAGMGLGLAIAKRIVAMHGGTIEVDSTVGQGTTFRVFLPTHD